MAVVEIDPKLIVRDSSVRGAIPILPMPLATLCFVLNLLVPGLGKEGNPIKKQEKYKSFSTPGTVMSGLFVCCCCCGRTRYTEDCNGDARFCAFVMNCIIGLSQFATILLCLVGWCWSVGWGITLISVASKLSNLK